MVKEKSPFSVLKTTINVVDGTTSIASENYTV